MDAGTTLDCTTVRQHHRLLSARTAVLPHPQQLLHLAHPSWLSSYPTDQSTVANFQSAGLLAMEVPDPVLVIIRFFLFFLSQAHSNPIYGYFIIIVTIICCIRTDIRITRIKYMHAIGVISLWLRSLTTGFQFPYCSATQRRPTATATCRHSLNVILAVIGRVRLRPSRAKIMGGSSVVPHCGKNRSNFRLLLECRKKPQAPFSAVMATNFFGR